MFVRKDENIIETLKVKLKFVAKQKLTTEKQIHKLLNLERSYVEDLLMIKQEIDFATEHMKELQEKISHIRFQTSMIEICKTSEDTKIKNHVNVLSRHRKGFDKLFDRERNLSEIRKRELREMEEQELEMQRQKEKEVAEKNEQQARQAIAIEKECDSIERECAVLKKRNTAIMLKLRRKLLETENVRRDLASKNNVDAQND